MTEDVANLDDKNQSIGRFDRSFLVHMIIDFFIILLVVTALEFSLKAALVYYDFQTKSTTDVENVATDIAKNVETIMLNQGGPIAARTLYPILQRNWNELGYKIAIEPSDATVEAIEQVFKFTPTGIPADEWPEGTHTSTKIDIRAQEDCLTCHLTADEGDVLGSVVVRSYLSTNFAKWWSDVKLSGGLALGKIVLHSIMLFLLLRIRMEPLLKLRSVVSNLSKAYSDLDQRAEIRTSDEFGVLARDLNIFLDRISRLVSELDGVLRNVVTVNSDIVEVQESLRDRVDGVVSRSRKLERQAVKSTQVGPLLSSAWFDTAKDAIGDLDAALAQSGDIPKAGDLVENLRTIVSRAENQVVSGKVIFKELSVLGEEVQSFQTAITEMTRLEERMKGVIETGTHLVGRLQTKD